MFKPSPVLGARLRLTTKQVNGGYYKGSRTGSMGSHTEYGGYLIDYRKVRHYKVPDLTDFNLTPFVTRQMEETRRFSSLPGDINFEPKDRKTDLMEYLRSWRDNNPEEYSTMVNWQIETGIGIESEGEAKAGSELASEEKPSPQTENKEDLRESEREFMGEKKA